MSSLKNIQTGGEKMKQDTVILYQPKIDFAPYYPCFWAPLSILSVAAPLVSQGVRVILLDGNLEENQKDKEIIKDNLERCICVGISSMIGGNQLERGLNIARFIKDQRHGLPVILGGPATSVISEQLFEDPNIDYLVLGQGEQPVSDLVNNLIQGKNTENIHGIMSRNKREMLKPVFQDKNLFPPYPWYLLDAEKYIREDRYLGKRILNYASSQGCSYRCGYCSESASYSCHWKALTGERTFNEVKQLKINYNLDGIKFYDANFFVNPGRVIDFAKRLNDSNLQLNWGASAHPKGVIRLADNLAEIKKSGLNRLLIGAESGSQNTLDYIHKGCTVEDNILTAKLCAEHHISSAFTFIVGLPGIKDDISKTLEMVIKIKKISGEFDVKIHFYAPFPGTPLFSEAKEFGYHSPTTLREWSSYDYYLIQTPWVDKKEEDKIRRFGDFYCDFLYPPNWFLEVMKSKPISNEIYKVLRKVVELRCKIHFYGLPLEMNWFSNVTGKKTFQ